MELTRLINHPELMDKETLYDLRSTLALHPYYQTARLLMLQNLFLLHDPSFDAELRKGAVYLGDRRKLFDLVEAAHYTLDDLKVQKTARNAVAEEHVSHPAPSESSAKSRTATLIDDFLDSIPQEAEPEKKRKPTPADASIDYVAYLLEAEEGADRQREEQDIQMKGQSLIDNFIDNEGGRIQLPDSTEQPDGVVMEKMVDEMDENDINEGFFTETLKQGRFERALEIIRHLNLNYPKKNAYFADQMRFLEKLILNNKQNN